MICKTQSYFSEQFLAVSLCFSVIVAFKLFYFVRYICCQNPLEILIFEERLDSGAGQAILVSSVLCPQTKANTSLPKKNLARWSLIKVDNVYDTGVRTLWVWWCCCLSDSQINWDLTLSVLTCLALSVFFLRCTNLYADRNF